MQPAICTIDVMLLCYYCKLFGSCVAGACGSKPTDFLFAFGRSGGLKAEEKPQKATSSISEIDKVMDVLPASAAEERTKMSL